ncbi:MAG TPA: lipopolysaccharide assembly protein LapA domain-containing protein [Stellaceae bacterium]|nr:lipopolysaccharide assembly protein LapA domain-containing protein [Stellaceae bacterium]
MRTLYWLSTALVALICVGFAVSNRAGVTLAFWPLGMELSAPLYLIVLLALLAGFLIGLLVAWIWSWGPRRVARQRARRIEVLERDLAAAEQRAKGTAVVVPHS